MTCLLKKKKFSLALQANCFYIVSHEYLEQNEIIGFHLFNCTSQIYLYVREAKGPIQQR